MEIHHFLTLRSENDDMGVDLNLGEVVVAYQAITFIGYNPSFVIVINLARRVMAFSMAKACVSLLK